MQAKTIGKLVIGIFAAVLAVGVVIRAFVIPAMEAGAQAAQEQSGAYDVKAMEASAGLGSDDYARVGAYADSTLEVAEMLEANVWSDGNGSVLYFERGFYVLDVNGEQSAHKLVLGKTTATTSTKDDASVKKTDIAAAAEGEPVIVSITETKSKDDVLCELASSAFGANHTFERTDPSREITVEKPDANTVAAIGGDEAFNQVAVELADFIALRYPSANTAMWSHKSSFDYEKGEVSINYKLDDRLGSSVKLVWKAAGGVEVTSG